MAVPRHYSLDLLRALKDGQQTVTERGLEIVVKPIPEGGPPGAMDPRTYAQMAPMFKGVKGVIGKMMMKRMGKSGDPIKGAQGMRRMMDGVKSIPITDGVATERRDIRCGDVTVPVRIYRKEPISDTPAPVLYYIHGGGFVAGSPDVVEEMCKLAVAVSGCVSVTVDYRLAPEHPYPAGLDDCYAVLNWIFDNAAGIGGDPARVTISGDSAGGNLATVCALRDRDKGLTRLYAQALLYPTVNMAGQTDDNFHFSMDQYEMLKEHEPIITPMLTMMSGSMGSLGAMLGVKDTADPYISPYLADLKGLPPCIILFGEHDPLRLECEAYARKLKAAGVPVKTVRYRGLGHGFADVIGGYPQAEDCMREICGFMEERV